MFLMKVNLLFISVSEFGILRNSIFWFGAKIMNRPSIVPAMILVSVGIHSIAENCSAVSKLCISFRVSHC